ncbi:MAG: 4-(cytidine 5'-diphospho)-2-C-methyl-D-erythritol kinase [Bacteroidota bacterium]|nr:4-(cytidine 5'-diphospho)-2-C-methyl-D-erythritol kinase [Bacteroidota bacterium]
MVVFPNCKINLGLNIIRKREDGYHDLETVFYPLSLRDALEAIRSPDSTGNNGIHFTQSGILIPGDHSTNLCVKAWHLLRKDFPQMGPVTCHLHKVIPMGAGLGGGSADGAFMLQLLNQLYHLGMEEKDLREYALQLGSDCPFFISNTPCFATGRGEILEPYPIDLSAYRIILVNPGIHISTAQAFAGIQPTRPGVSISRILQQPVAEWRDQLFNDFEKSLSQIHSKLAAIKTALYDQGAVYASLTGTGSTVYGLFDKNHPQPFVPHSDWKVYEG